MVSFVLSLYFFKLIHIVKVTMNTNFRNGQSAVEGKIYQVMTKIVPYFRAAFVYHVLGNDTQKLRLYLGKWVG